MNHKQIIEIRRRIAESLKSHVNQFKSANQLKVRFDFKSRSKKQQFQAPRSTYYGYLLSEVKGR